MNQSNRDIQEMRNAQALIEERFKVFSDVNTPREIRNRLGNELGFGFAAGEGGAFANFNFDTPSRLSALGLEAGETQQAIGAGVQSTAQGGLFDSKAAENRAATTALTPEIRNRVSLGQTGKLSHIDPGFIADEIGANRILGSGPKEATPANAVDRANALIDLLGITAGGTKTESPFYPGLLPVTTVTDPVNNENTEFVRKLLSGELFSPPPGPQAAPPQRADSRPAPLTPEQAKTAAQQILKEIQDSF